MRKLPASGGLVVAVLADALGLGEEDEPFVSLALPEQPAIKADVRMTVIA
ncbi:hypothetical protein [Paenibacillus plantarum]|nr:hypothetical protein [Paenibacillus plantarum]